MLTVDLTGTAPQIDDKPINMPLEGTVDCAIWLTLRSILLDSERYGHIPQNSGLTRPITLHVPKGTLANPICPAPTIARFCPGNQLADTVMTALSKVVPEKVAAGIGNLRVWNRTCLCASSVMNCATTSVQPADGVAGLGRSGSLPSWKTGARRSRAKVTSMRHGGLPVGTTAPPPA